ncbi:MAG: hypothetical protein U9O83_02640 [Campylobacterota bacterium]|nr:hypothetical protein [Campylobacterota bacterium]
MKNFVADAIKQNPQRYAIDGGDLHLINDYFIFQKWKPLIREQHTSIAGLIRMRITVLKDNPLDMRLKHKPKENPKQSDIYQLIGDAVIESYSEKSGAEVKKVLSHLERHPHNISKPPSTIKKSIRGYISTQSIDLSKFIFRVCKDKMVTKYLNKAPLQRKEVVKGGDKMQTNKDKK